MSEEEDAEGKWMKVSLDPSVWVKKKFQIGETGLVGTFLNLQYFLKFYKVGQGGKESRKKRFFKFQNVSCCLS